jgi:hypothetical protein
MCLIASRVSIPEGWGREGRHEAVQHPRRNLRLALWKIDGRFAVESRLRWDLAAMFGLEHGDQEAGMPFNIATRTCGRISGQLRLAGGDTGSN